MTINPRDEFWLLHEKYHDEKTNDFWNDRARLEKGEPVAYVIGWIPFHRATIMLDHHPLIPRPETEYWVEEACKEIDATCGHNQLLSFADVYAGSGCVGVHALMRFPHARCTFVDIGADECAQIETNVKANLHHPERSTVLCGDACGLISGPYDAIFANPPYIDKDAGNVDESVTLWEPSRALFAEEHGLFEIKRLLVSAQWHLKKEAPLYCEFGKNQEPAIARLPEAGAWNIEFRKDQYGVDRWFKATAK